jgi:type II secretory ATPase GspE/PulE/Tfp pilus assembly ATPase PilB-like protein
VTLIVSQRLLRRLCKQCKGQGKRPITEPEGRLFQRHNITAPEHVYDAVSGNCEHCRSTGYKGQIAAIEMLPITEEVAEMIAEKKSVRLIVDWMREHNYPRVYQAALELVTKGETTLAEANHWQAVWEDLQISNI